MAINKRDESVKQMSDLFGQLKRAMHVYSSEQFSELGLSLAQLGVLRCISSSQPVSQKDLAQMMQLTPGAVSQYIDALDQANCIVRTVNEADRRISYLSVSRDGKDVLKRYDKLRQQILSESVKDLPDSDIESYVRVQQALISWLESQANRK